MITYKDIYEAAKKNPLVLFESPQNAEWRFLIASGKIVISLQEDLV